MGFVSRAMERAIERRFHPSTFDSKLYGFWGGGRRSASGTSVRENTVLCIGAVFACVRLISGTISALPFITYERLQPRGKRRAAD